MANFDDIDSLYDAVLGTMSPAQLRDVQRDPASYVAAINQPGYDATMGGLFPMAAPVAKAPVIAQKAVPEMLARQPKATPMQLDDNGLPPIPMRLPKDYKPKSIVDIIDDTHRKMFPNAPLEKDLPPIPMRIAGQKYAAPPQTAKVAPSAPKISKLAEIAQETISVPKVEEAPVGMPQQDFGPDIGPILPTYQDPSMRKPEYAENYRKNVDRALLGEMARQGELEGDKAEAKGERKQSRDELMKLVGTLEQQTETFKPSNSYDDILKKLLDVNDLAPSVEKGQKDNYLEIAQLFVPVLGAMTGQEGALAQAQTMKSVESKIASEKKNEIERLKLAADKKNKISDAINKRIDAIKDLRKGEYEIFDKDRQAKLNQLKELRGALTVLTDKDQEQLNKIADRLGTYDRDITKNVMTGSKELAGMEQKATEEKAKYGLEDKKLAQAMELEKMRQAGLDRRARMAAAKQKEKGENLPLDVKTRVSVLARKTAEIETINNQIKTWNQQLSDKSLSFADRLSTAQEQLKLINSAGTATSDAIGAEEKNRLAAWLDPMPNLVKPKLGPDLDGFARQIARISQRLDASKAANQGAVDEAMGRKPKGSTTTQITPNFPRSVYKGNKKATVSNEAELKDAQSKGWQ